MSVAKHNNNVVTLHRNIDDNHLSDAQQSIEFAKQVRKDFCSEITEMAIEQVFATMHSYGALVDRSRIHSKDMLMIEQAIESALHRYYRLEHPLHEVSDNVFEIEDDDQGEIL